MPRGLVKICGLNTSESVTAAISAGADMLGFVFFPKSPRHISVEQATALVAQARDLSQTVQIVALTVNLSDTDLEAICGSIAPNWLQLHGKEAPDRVVEVRREFATPVMKAIGIANAEDAEDALRYATVAERLLLDAKPTAGALPGGNGVMFDHRLIAGHDFGVPYLLSGGLNADNVAEAVALTRPDGVDVSSGVESAPGVKDVARIHAFVRAAREALDSAAQ
nr:phosphoribosylanthranilate isomerase [Pseudochelatococcus contaminans]